MRFLTELVNKYLIRPVFRKYLDYRVNKVRVFYKQSIDLVNAEFLAHNMSMILKKADLSYHRKKRRQLPAVLKSFHPKHNELRAIATLPDGQTEYLTGKVIRDLHLWSTEIAFSGIKNNLAYVRFIENAYYESLRVDTNALGDIYAWTKSVKNFEVKSVTQPLSSLAFYSLVIGVLDETGGRATVADLYEHFVEKTDVRFKHALFNRKRGVRMKLFNVDNRDYLVEKLSNIQNPNEIVVLAPVTLARFAFHYHSALFDDSTYFSGIGDVGEDLAEIRQTFHNEYYLATRLKLVFASNFARYSQKETIAQPKDVVPPLFKRLVKYYVMNYGILTTHVLREREKKQGVNKAAAKRKRHRGKVVKLKPAS